jgi:hypothetical protein
MVSHKRAGATSAQAEGVLDLAVGSSDWLGRAHLRPFRNKSQEKQNGLFTKQHRNHRALLRQRHFESPTIASNLRPVSMAQRKFQKREGKATNAK